VVELASRQNGVVTRRQLLELGLTPRIVARWWQQKRLRPIHRGVYLVGAVAPPWAAERAALLACGAQAVLSHWTAARMAELPVRADAGSDVVHVTIPVSGGGRRPGVRAHRTGALHPAEVQRLHDLPVTTTARTLFDLAVPLGRLGQARTLERLVAVALERKLVGEAELRRLLQRHASHRGAGLLDLVLGQAGGPRLTRSEAEEALLRLIREADLPLPRMNVRVQGCEVDFLWEAERLVVEVDGWAWHSSRNRFEGDRARDARLLAAGFTVLRVTLRHIERTPLAVMARIAFMLGRLAPR
jgi:very-short-patch-repair endonuclease